jgi:hypothetical protein
MNKTIIFIVIMIMTNMLFGIWEEQRQSALLPDNELFIRTEIIEMEGAVNEFLFVSEQLVQRQPMIFIEDYAQTWQGVLPNASLTEFYLGYRTETPEQNYVLPVFNPLNDLSFNGMSLASEDAPDDTNFPYQHLEIIADFVSFNDEKLMIGIKNANGNYPTSESFTFFSYLGAITSPQGEKNDIIYALMHTLTQPGIIEPGLYKIFGTGMDDLTKLADIEVVIDEEVLLLSCEWQPLLDDEDFSQWFSPENPSFAFMSLTQKITLAGGVQTADEGKSCVIFPSKNEIFGTENTIPQITNLQEIISEDAFIIQVDYYDAEENFPIVTQIEFDNGQIRSFFPQSLDYSGIVSYQTPDISDIVYLDDWSQAVIRFSDDGEQFTELIYPETSSHESQLSPLQFSLFPNPVSLRSSSGLSIAFQNRNSGSSSVSVYNLKGQKIRALPLAETNNTVLWDWRDNSGKRVGSGIYFLKLQDGNRDAVRKVILLP